MNKITWSIFIAISVGLMALLVILSDKTRIDVSNIDVTKIQAASLQSGKIADHVYGNTESKVVLIEYGDFQCPACATQFPVTKAVIEEYKDRVQLIFRNYPLTTIHPNAKISAAAAESAGLQGKFWEMHDLLYQNQLDWSTATGDERVNAMADFAKELKLDVDKFKADMGSSQVIAKIAFDTALAAKIKVPGTPTFYLNGELIDGNDWGDVDKFKATLDKALAELTSTK